MRLYPVLPHHPGETPASFVSRLARQNRIPSALFFCGDMGLNHARILSGDPDALAGLAELVGMDPAPLKLEAVRKSERRWALRGQMLAAGSYFGDPRRVCRQCLSEDLRNLELPLEARPWFRSIWHVVNIRACPIHQTFLTEMPRPSDLGLQRDFARFVAPYLDRMADRASPQVFGRSSLEDYLLHRLDGGAGPTWLDGMPFYVAAQACEMVGSVALYGRRPGRKSLGQAERRQAGDAGLDVLDGGPEAFDEFLDGLRRSADGAGLGPKGWFGDLYDWLRDNARNPDYELPREAVARHVCDHKPMLSGSVVLGRKVDRPKLLSVRTVHIETGLHAYTVRRVLSGAGHLSPRQSGADGTTVLEAGPAEDLLRRLRGCLGKLEVLARLGLSRGQFATFFEAGLLQPLVAGSRSDAGRPRYAVEDVDSLLARLREGAPQVDVAPSGCVSLPKAAHCANSPLNDLLGHVLEGRLPCLAWSTHETGMRGIYVDLAASKGLFRGPELEGLIPAEVQQRLGVTNETVNGLTEGGLLPTERQRHPTKHYDVNVIRQESLAAFMGLYVKLFEVARQAGLHHLAAKARLEAEGVRPVFHGEGKIATFYRRSDVEGFFPTAARA